MTRHCTLAVLTMLVATAASAQTTPPAGAQMPAPAAAPAVLPPGAQFAFINLQFIVSESKLGKAGLAQLKRVQDVKDEQLKLMSNELVALQQRLDAQRGLLSADSLKTLAADIDTKQRKLQFESDTRDADLARLQRDLLDDFGAKVTPILDALRKEKGLIAIFGVRASDSGLSIVSADPGLDLSAEVIKRLDAAPGK